MSRSPGSPFPRPARSRTSCIRHPFTLLQTPPSGPDFGPAKEHGSPAFRPGQEELIRAVLAGRHALGYSVYRRRERASASSFLLFFFLGLWWSSVPCISLMEDQVGRARALGPEAEALSAAPVQYPSETNHRRCPGSGGSTSFVSPERLHLPEFSSVPTLPYAPPLVAIDEAHCVSLRAARFPPCVPEDRRDTVRLASASSWLWTATATPEVRREIPQHLRLPSEPGGGGRELRQAEPGAEWRRPPARGGRSP